MSIQAMAWVFDRSQAEGSDRLVLLAIANHCDSHWCCFPSVEQIATEARVSRSTVTRSVRSLVLLGELEVSTGGRGRGSRSTYRVGHYLGCQPDTLNPSFTMSPGTQKGVTGDPITVRNRTASRVPAYARDAFVPEGLLEAIPEEQRKNGLAHVRAIKARPA